MADEKRGERSNGAFGQFAGLHTSSCRSFNLQRESLGFRHFDGWVSRDLERMIENCDWRFEPVAKWDRGGQNCDVSKSDMQNPPIDH